MKRLIKCIELADHARTTLEIRYDMVLEELLRYFKFSSPNENEPNFFHIEYQPSDGIVLADNDANVYSLPFILSYIKENGFINNYEELRKFSI